MFVPNNKINEPNLSVKPNEINKIKEIETKQQLLTNERLMAQIIITLP